MAETDIRKAYQRVADAVLQAIRKGALQAGQRLPPERDLAIEYGVSRPTIREAMIALEVMGLVKSRHGSGVYITDTIPPDTTSVDVDIGAFELTEARIFFEGEVAALAATSATDQDIAELEMLLEEMRRENADPNGAENSDRRFHLAIANATRNAAMIQVVMLLWDMRTQSQLHTFTQDRARARGLQPRIEEHRQIVEAIRAHDPRAARASMRDHLRRVIETLFEATEIEAVERARTEKRDRMEEMQRRLRE